MSVGRTEPVDAQPHKRHPWVSLPGMGGSRSPFGAGDISPYLQRCEVSVSCTEALSELLTLTFILVVSWVYLGNSNKQTK